MFALHSVDTTLPLKRKRNTCDTDSIREGNNNDEDDDDDGNDTRNNPAMRKVTVSAQTNQS